MAEDETGFTFVDKRRAQAESAAEEAPLAAEPSAPEAVDEADQAGEDFGEATDVYGIIGYCLNLLAAEAWQKMGLLADPQTGEAKADLVQAKVAIDAAGDLAGRLESAPSEAIPEAARRELRTMLNNLRLNYVAQRDRSAQTIARP